VSPRTPGFKLALIVLASGLAALAVIAVTQQNGSAPNPAPQPTSAAPRHPVSIRQPIRQPRVDTGKFDPQGQPITVSCGSCHATSAPRPDTRQAAELNEFHQGLQYQHGSLTCLSCHDASNYDQLRLADGRGVPFPDAMSLCAQCHGPQYRDYSHGSHGGMSGHWDLSRGPRQRNHCVDCHDPHAPQFPVVQPAFPLPADRGLKSTSTAAPHHG
jgi:formate-dependent nitrite reductase cytochrome c552 subunit